MAKFMSAFGEGSWISPADDPLVPGDGDGVVQSHSNVFYVLHDLYGIDDVVYFLLLLVEEGVNSQV